MSESSLADFFAPPESIRGSKVLDRASFERQVELPAIKLQRANLCSLFIKRLAHAQLRFPTIKSVLNEPGEDGQVCSHKWYPMSVGVDKLVVPVTAGRGQSPWHVCQWDSLSHYYNCGIPIHPEGKLKVWV